MGGDQTLMYQLEVSTLIWPPHFGHAFAHGAYSGSSASQWGHLSAMREPHSGHEAGTCLPLQKITKHLIFVRMAMPLTIRLR